MSWPAYQAATKLEMMPPTKNSESDATAPIRIVTPSEPPEPKLKMASYGEDSPPDTLVALRSQTEKTCTGTTTTATAPMTARGRLLMIVYEPSSTSDNVMGPTGAGGRTGPAWGPGGAGGDTGPGATGGDSTPLSGATHARSWCSMGPFWRAESRRPPMACDRRPAAPSVGRDRLHRWTDTRRRPTATPSRTCTTSGIPA